MPCYQLFCSKCSQGISLFVDTFPEHFVVTCQSCRTVLFRTQLPKTVMQPKEKEKWILSNRYVLENLLGRGGNGTVYKALDRNDQSHVAIKIIHEDVNVDEFTGEADRLSRLLREVSFSSDIAHPNIVHIKDCSRSDLDKFPDRPYIVMELIEGPSLKDYVTEKKGMDPLEATEMVCSLCQTLYFLFKKHNLIHRDIKPDNILLHPLGKTLVPKLIDFGLAKVIGETSITKSNTGMGTPFYMPVEQIKDAKRATHQSDIYALGATFYFMLAGIPPYWEYKGNMEVLRAKILPQKYKARSLQEHFDAKGLPLHPVLAQAVEKSMAEDPSGRFRDSMEMREFLRTRYLLKEKERISKKYYGE